MKNIPEKIYLIIGDECPSDANFKDLREVTWSSNSNFKNDIEYVLATEDKKAPVESTAESFYERFVPYEWNEINQQTKDGILKAMQEYASQGRNRAISECIEIVKKEQLDTDDHYGYVACANILEKLKK